MSQRSTTPKQRVLKKWDDAFAASFADCWCIYRGLWSGNICIGTGKTAALAWADAARNL